MPVGERGDKVSTSCDCDVILVIECFTREIHIGETGHV